LVLIRRADSIRLTIERYGFSGYLISRSSRNTKIALVGDSYRAAHRASNYIATIARMRGVRLRAFSTKPAAVGC